MLTFLSVLLMLGILSVLIIFHEFGHFSVARFFGFQTPVFGFGLPFGPSWTIGTFWNTQFKVHACLLGGYVAIPELGDESAMSAEAYGVPLKPFRKFPIWQRALVAFAGVFFNMILAYIVMIAMLLVLGAPSDKVVVDDLSESIPIARQAGVEASDRILSIDNTSVSNTQEIIDYLAKNKSKEVTLHILRDNLGTDTKAKTGRVMSGEGQKIDITLTTNADGKVGMLLYCPPEKVSGGPEVIASKAFTGLYDLTSQMLSTLGRLFSNIAFGWMEHHEPGKAPEAGIKDLHGVLVVIKFGADIAQTDWTKLFTFTALISMDLAIVNLLPIPALDGGHLFFMLIEAIRGKPMQEKVQGELVKWGFVSLLLLMAVITVNDIRAWLSGELDFKKSKKQTSQTNQIEIKKENKEIIQNQENNLPLKHDR